jgi:hypothetical protein
MSLANVSALGVCVLCVASVADAHHSRALYDMTAEVVIEGTVAELEWRNPHISMTVATTGADGVPLRREIEVMSVSEARALGLRQEAIAPGAHVVVRAHPGRSGPGARAVGLDVRTGDGSLLPLNTDAKLSAAPVVVARAESLGGRWAPSVTDFYAALNAMGNWPFTDASRAAMRSAGSEPSALLGICADYPPPLLAVFPDLREIEIGATTVVLRFEAQGQNLARVVHLDQTEHPASVAPSLLGHSIGRWEGKTLVIDSIAFAPHPVGVMFGVPSGPAKHLIERFTLTDDRRHLKYDLTIEDSASLTKPATMSSQWDYRPDLAPSHVTCDPASARKVIQR